MFEAIDASAVVAAQSGQTEAVDELISRCWPDAYRLALAIGGHALAEDAAQEACATLIRSLPGLRDPAAFAGWFYRIVINSVRTLQRHVRRRERTQAHETSAGRLSPSAEASDARIDIESALAALPHAQREAIVLHYYADLTSAEIARITGTHSGTIRYHLFWAKRRLRTLLTDTSTTEKTFTEANGHA